MREAKGEHGLQVTKTNISESGVSESGQVNVKIKEGQTQATEEAAHYSDAILMGIHILSASQQ